MKTVVEQVLNCLITCATVHVTESVLHGFSDSRGFVFSFC